MCRTWLCRQCGFPCIRYHYEILILAPVESKACHSKYRLVCRIETKPGQVPIQIEGMKDPPLLLLTHITIQMNSLHQTASRELRWKSRRGTALSDLQTRTPSPESELQDQLTDRSARKRQRKSNDQIQILKDELATNPVWSKQDITELARRTGLSESQVYKWSWDYRKKSRIEPEKSPQVDACQDVCGHMRGADASSLECSELLMPVLLDSGLYEVQRAYRLDLNHYRLNGCTPSRYLVAPIRLVFP